MTYEPLMPHRALIYTVDPRSADLRKKVRAALPKLVRHTKGRPHLTCQYCGGPKTRPATQCRACWRKHRRMGKRAASAGIPLGPTPTASLMGHDAGRRRRGKTGRAPEQPTLRSMVKQPDGTWEEVEWTTTNAGTASPVVSPASRPGSSSSTGPTGPSDATPTAAATRSGSSTRRPIVTSALPAQQTDWNARAPRSNPEIARIMEERKVGRKRAYAILRAEKNDEFTVEIPATQRAQILTHLVENAGQAKNAMVLMEELHAQGVGLDMHDVVKTLWSLQKTRFVRFRERNNPPSLYAIKVTDEGLAAYDGMKRRLIESQRAIDEVAAEMTAQAEQKRILNNARALQEEMMKRIETAKEEAEPEQPPEPEPVLTETVADDLDLVVESVAPSLGYVKLPWIPKTEMGGFPALREVRDRARRAEKINAAARLLEEAGEEETAIELMDKTTFNPLEQDVIALLRALEEL